MAAIRSRIILKGDKKLISELRSKTGETFDRMKKVQNNTARDILLEAQRKVPKATFELSRSARIQEDSGNQRLRTIAVTYDTDYAVAVHEDMEAKHAPGQEAKFLERPAKSQRRRYSSEMKAAMQGGLK